MVLAKENLIADRFDEEIQGLCLACGTQIAKQKAAPYHSAAPEAVQPSEERLACRKSGYCQISRADMRNNPLDHVGELDAVGEIRLHSPFLRGHHTIEFPIAWHYLREGRYADGVEFRLHEVGKTGS